MTHEHLINRILLTPVLKQDMITNTGIGGLRNLLESESPSGKVLQLKAGTILKAEVMDITGNGNALLRIMTAVSGREAQQGTIINAFTEVPLAKGQNIYLEVLGGKDSIKMQLLADIKDPQTVLRQNIPAKFLEMLARLSGSRLANTEFKDLLNMLRSLPESIKTAVQEFEGLEKLMLGAKQLDGNVLRAFVETSGVAFETRLKIAVLNDPRSVLQNLIVLQAEGDLKGLLLKLKDLLKTRDAAEILKQAGFKVSEVSSMVEKFIRHVEFFQLTSRIDDMFYTFLPVMWEGLKDSEFMFRRDHDENNESFTCDINLDLEKLGKLSVSVTVMEKALYVSFFVERPEVADLISSGKKLLEERFASLGLVLKAINVNQNKGILFGKAQNKGVNLKI
jgi:hypothetical protein